MYNQLRIYASACFYYSGLVTLMRWIQRSRPCLTILYYHQAAQGDLRRHWLYLRRHYRILPLEKALEELYAAPKGGKKGNDRRSLLAVTFDDGYFDNYTHAFPLACELHVPITIFLIPAYTNGSTSFWWATHLIRFAGAEQVIVAGYTYHLGCPVDRKVLAQVIDARFSRCTSSNEREEFLTSLYKILAVPSSVVMKEKPVPLLTWAKVHEMQKSGYVSFGAHTLHHPDLRNLPDPAEAQREVGECRTVLEQQLGYRVNTFAYPYGNTGEHGLSAVQQTGYDWAVTTIPGVNTCHSNPYLLKRRKMDTKHWLVMAAETAGIWELLSHLKNNFTRFIRKGRGHGTPGKNL